MKRQILTLGAICAAAFTLTNCNKEIAEPKAPVTEGIPFEIVATTADTKTKNDGLNTKWTAGDALNVFHAEAGTTTYGTNDQFTYTGAYNKFKGKLTTGLEADKYDWYALYPYNDKISTPTGTPTKTGDNYTLIGKKTGKATGDTQDGNDSKAHLSGRSCPMYAVAKNVEASDVPTFTMKHLTSVVAVTVTNTNDDHLIVNSVSFSAPEGTTIFGSFFINFTENGDPVYTNHTTASWTSNTSNLTVKNGTPIAKNGKATFYLAIKPFAAKVGDELKISVNGYEKTHKLTKNVEFKAGKIEAVNFKSNKAIAAETLVAKFVATGIGSGYSAHEKVTSNGKNWTVTFGQGTYVGTNSGNKANCKLGKTYEKVGTPCGYTDTQTQVAAIISESALANVSKVVVNGDTDKYNPEKISLVYSTDGTTYSLIETKTYSKAVNEFTFAKKANAYYAVVLYHKGGGTDIFMRTKDLVVSFYE